ncbi:MAG: MmcQ/YjbR family DNA-binding protein [Gemmatales bacterium]
MTAAKFRSLALSLPETVAAEHMNHPDFRVGGKIFATLGWPDAGHGMVKLTPIQQAAYVQAHPTIFKSIDNGWGRKGAYLRRSENCQSRDTHASTQRCLAEYRSQKTGVTHLSRLKRLHSSGLGRTR